MKSPNVKLSPSFLMKNKLTKDFVMLNKSSLETLCYLNSDGKVIKKCPNLPDEQTLIKGYKVMCLTRHLDDRMITLQRQGLISFSLSSLGEEAASVASAAALSIEDWIYPQYREAGALFWRGFSVEDFVHHMFGNAKDLMKGRQMPNHFGCRQLNVVTVSSPIATKIPHAAGCAYAMQLQKDRKIAICYFGEGATSEGDFHTGVNFASVQRVPCIFFCRNNMWAISTPEKDQYRSDGIAPKGIGYGIETKRVDGNDFFAVYSTVKKAKELCLKGKGPVLIEAMTYRMGAHSTSDDPTRYRKNVDVKKQAKKCPIKRLKSYLESQKLWNKKKELSMQKEIKEKIDAAIEVAKNTPRPALETLFEDVYFEMPKSLKQQLSLAKEQSSE